MAYTEFEIIKKVHEVFRSKSLTLAIAESCTAGLVSHRLASLPGARKFFHSSLVCYSPESAVKLLGVSSSILEEHGTVSEELAREMAARAEKMTGADVALAVSCDLHPEPAGDRNPGLAYVAVSSGKEATSRGLLFEGTAEEIQQSATVAALEFLYDAVAVWT